MIGNRRAAALILAICLLASPAAALAAGKTSRLTTTPPSWLSAPHPARPSAGATNAGRQLPRTGFNLLPEVVLGGLLVSAGLILRLRRA